MTAFNKNMLPNEINSFEKLLVWCASIAHEIYYAENYPVTNVTNSVVAQSSLSNDNNGQLRMYSIFALPINNTGFWSATTPVWQRAVTVNSVSIPSSYQPVEV